MNYSALYSPWKDRIISADKLYKNWESKFRCSLLNEYYEGFMWRQKRDYPTTNYIPYSLNLFYSTIKIKLSSLLFQKPKFNLTPQPGNSQWNQEFAIRSAQIKEDVLNTIVRNRNINFTRQVKLACQDSFTRFGIMEIGYANDWRNPLKDDPYLKSWEDPDIDESKDRVLQDDPVPVNERFYVKRIHPSRFRVAVSDSCDLNEHDWCGYYDYYYTRTLMKTPGIKWPKEHTGTGSFISAEFMSGYLGVEAESNLEFRHLYTEGEISRVYHIWDNVSKTRCLLLDDEKMSVLWEGDFNYLNLVDLRWDLRDKGFYPIPPTFQWISPQDEINEAREQTRSYRRRFTRKFQALKGQVDEEEKEKFASGPDGIIIEVKQPDAIKAIDNPEIGPTSENALVIAKDDFNTISGTSAEARGQDADRETATQAKIVDARSQIRESAEQMDFSVFLCDVARSLLLQARENMQLGIWVKYTSDPGEQNPQQMQNDQPVYDYITSQELDDGYDFEIEFDVSNATPAAMASSQQSFINFVQIVQNPLIMMSPALIREAAYRVGYRNEAVIKQMQQAALQHLKMQALQAQAGALNKGQQGNNPQNQATAQQAQMATPGAQQIGDQLNAQLS